MPDNDLASLSPTDRDLVIRTVIGEAGNQPSVGQAAVASVILNRMRDGGFGGPSARNIVLAPNQFEAWSARPKELQSIPDTSPIYKNVGNIVDQVFSGKTKDPTGGATYFMNPDVVRARNGGVIPQKWAQGPGQRIGQHVFFKPASAMNNQIPDYLGTAIGASPPSVATVTPSAPSSAPPDYLSIGLQSAPDPEVPSAPTPAKAADNRSVADKLLGIGGPRYQTWPERLVRTVASEVASGLTLPGDVESGRATVPQSANFPGANGEDTSNLGRLINLAGVVGTGSIPVVAGARAPLIDPATAKLAQTARDVFGIPIRGGQISESPFVNFLDSVLKEKPFSGYAGNVAQQKAAFNRNVAGAIGEDADKVTPEVMDAAKKRLGVQYEDIAAKSTINADAPLYQTLTSIANDAGSVLAPNETSVVHNQIGNILDRIKDGTIDGKTYQALIKTGSPLDRATKSNDANVKYYAGQVKQALIDALGRSVSPELKDKLASTNSQYKAMKTIEDLVEKSPTGDISPALLMSAVRKSYGGMAYGNGGPLADLARVGQRFLKEPPNSGTASRLSAMKLLGLGGAGGVEAGLAFHDPILAAKIAALATTAATAKAGTNAALGSILRSNWYANRLINSAVPRESASPLQKLVRGAIPYNPPAEMLLPFPAYESANEPQPVHP
ncbi:MAG TPA: cell wall hydrolase [Pseudolabrys sp.]|nr:cell wall hydrolase [Pseudolabrys sp.]